MFYAGMHYVNAYLQHQTGTVPTRHAERDRCVRVHMTQVRNSFRELRSICDDARYQLVDPTPTDKENCRQRLSDIEAFVRQHVPS